MNPIRRFDKKPGISDQGRPTRGQSSGCQSARGVCVRDSSKPTIPVLFAMLVTSMLVDPITRVATLGTEPAAAIPTALLVSDRALLTGPVALSAKLVFDIACLTSPSDIPAKSYFVGTLSCVRCNHGIVYPPSPILRKTRVCISILSTK